MALTPCVGEDVGGPAALLRVERELWSAQVGQLDRALRALIVAGENANADDEHDPEGATFAVERSQLIAQLDHARARVVDVDAALDRVAAGTYGVCARCGAGIAAARLAARPTAATCITCASTPHKTAPTWP